jgi:hypothetical protein
MASKYAESMHMSLHMDMPTDSYIDQQIYRSGITRPTGANNTGVSPFFYLNTKEDPAFEK